MTEATGPDPALTLHEVTIAYGAAPVVSDVSLAVGRGQWLAIVGPNGAGKSTLLKAIAGLVEYRGSVTLDSTRIDRLSPSDRARRIGYAPQNPALPERLTVTDYVLLGRTPHLGFLARETAADLSIVEDVLDRVDLRGLMGRRLGTLSGGEAQRAVLARVLAQRTGLLLLDEPTTGLDIGHAQTLLERLDQLRAEDNATVVTTLHDLTLAAQYADELVLVDRGGIVAAGKPSEVLTAERLREHYAAEVEVLTTTDGRPVVAPVRPRHA
ncbi:ABC transporter ATP-binding protein [Prauserella rugosa]|uniref:Iron complex transport system ATP-binding protein n=1 Tax=Prauserella rugosa TaxID=43354 RepID=A0A660CGP5_9PSEU|nr:ABC transporter ATP-binding protein [Prauserella rugosa]TWH20191.1 iron complex transport system ATP-binding protein [Prauserella rugosa]